MSDDPFYSPTHTLAPRLPQPGESLWTLFRDAHALRAELRNDSELQLYLDGEFWSGKHYASREIALEEAVGCRQRCEAKGWVPE